MNWSELEAGRHPCPEIIVCDLYKEGAAEELAKRALAQLGKIEILINSAGGSRPIPFEATKDQLQEGLTLNFWRLRELTHAVIPSMKAHGITNTW